MRSFLIRDILSGSAAAQQHQHQASSSGGHLTGLASQQQPNAAATTTLASQSHFPHQLDQASGSFESLAASQARFLAKWAEHQHQQLQASEYFKQIQQAAAAAAAASQGAHLNQQQLLQNLNNLSHLHQLQQQQQQQQSHHNNQAQSRQQQQQLHQQALSAALGPTGLSALTNCTIGPLASFPQMTASSATESNGGSHPGAIKSQSPQSSADQLKAPTKTKKPSFAYDCTSPISSISDIANDIEAEEEEDGDGDDDDDDARVVRNGDHHKKSRSMRGASAKNVGSDNDDDDSDNQDDDNNNSKTNNNHDGDDDDEDDDNDDDDESGSENGEIDVDDRASSGRRHSFNNAMSNSSVSYHEQAQSSQLATVNKEQQQQLQAPFQLNSPLDALFQMTSSTFDALKRGEKRKDREGDHQGATNFNSKQSSKKKRKSRTAFTNNQIYELERRFRMQKYLSPTDRDEIAMTLNLSNAQVITWFQNRRAKMKRDLEEQKRDIETASLLNLHKTFLESFQALSQMKTTAIKPAETALQHDH